MRIGRAYITAVVLGGLCMASVHGDWPGWRGANRDGICIEKGLLKEWPAEGPNLLWNMKGVGTGYSSVSIVGNRLFTMGDLEDGGSKKQYTIAVDLSTRKIVWKTEVGPPHRDGSRCTPTVDGNLLYALGTSSDLVCVRASDGREVWRKNLERDFGGKMMSSWRWSESPLVDGDMVLCTPGVSDAAIVALDKKTGRTIWKTRIPKLGSAGKDGAGYSSIVVSEACGIKQYVQLMGRGVIGVDAESGKFLWGYNRVANSVANITTPVVSDDYVFVSTQYSTGSAVLKLSRDSNGMRAREVCWLNANEFQNHHGGVILVDGHLYGGTNKSGGPPTCIELKTGKILWQKPAPAKGSAAYLYADGRFIVRYDKGPVTLVEATPEGHRVVSQFTPLKTRGPAWAHPVLDDGKLYLRHNELLMCYDVKGK